MTSIGQPAAAPEASAAGKVPALYYDLELYNRISVDIHDNLRQSFDACGKILAAADEDRRLNLTAVFFHELMRLLCSYCFRLMERRQMPGIHAPEGLLFPAPAGGLRQKAGRLLRQAVAQAQALAKGGATEVAYASNVAADISQLQNALDQAASSRPLLLRPLRPGDTRLHLPCYREQFQALMSGLGRLRPSGCPELSLGPAQGAALDRFFRSHLAGRPAPPLKAQALLVGSLCRLEARLAAAKASAQGVPVVSVYHGEAFGVVDEPLLGYGEQSYLDTLVGFGRAGWEALATARYARPLFGDPIAYVPSSSDKARAVYSREPIPSVDELSEPVFMYLPTLFSGDDRYGPFRDMHDQAYLEWQKELLGALAEARPGRVIWKRHPKGRRLDIPHQGVEQVFTNFDQVLSRAGVFVFDFISSAFHLAAATAKPIIFLDIGLRNPTGRALELIQERCLYVPADPRRPREALERAAALFGQPRTNRYTEAFSLAGDQRPRAQIIAQALAQAAGGRRA